MTDLSILQEYANKIAIERGHGDNTPEEICFRLAFEVNELIEAILVRRGIIKVHAGAKVGVVRHEFGDAFNMLCRAANMEEEDLESSFIEKVKMDEGKKYVKVI